MMRRIMNGADGDCLAWSNSKDPPPLKKDPNDPKDLSAKKKEKKTRVLVVNRWTNNMGVGTGGEEEEEEEEWYRYLETRRVTELI
jgi:hypothetical protein